MPIISGESGGFDGGTISGNVLISPPGSGTALLELLCKVGQTNDAIVADSDANAFLWAVLPDGAITHITDSLRTAYELQVSQAPDVGNRILKVVSAISQEVGLLDRNGQLFISNPHSAPADADIQAGECFLWFDQTNGAGNTKFMLKGKSADGTVKTASVVLA